MSEQAKECAEAHEALWAERLRAAYWAVAERQRELAAAREALRKLQEEWLRARQTGA